MTDPDDKPRRRAFIERAGRIGMVLGLIAGYGGFAAVVGRYVFRTERRRSRRLFVAALREFAPGTSRTFVGPAGDRVAVARHDDSGNVTDFVALSSTCPHLGCQVHWQQEHQRFFCPCHNGAFDARGVAREGPPARDGQSLARYELHVEAGLLFIELAV